MDGEFIPAADWESYSHTRTAMDLQMILEAMGWEFWS